MAVIWVVGLWDISYSFFLTFYILNNGLWVVIETLGVNEIIKRWICKMREITPGQNPGNSNIYGVDEGKGISEEDGERASKEIEENKGWLVSW